MLSAGRFIGKIQASVKVTATIKPNLVFFISVSGVRHNSIGELSLNDERYRFADDTVICDRGKGPVNAEASVLLVLLG